MEIHFFWCREASGSFHSLDPSGQRNGFFHFLGLKWICLLLGEPTQKHQKKWKTVSKTRFSGLRVRPKRSKEMEKHWENKVLAFRRFSRKPENLIKPMEIHFFWPSGGHPKSLNPCKTNGIPFLLASRGGKINKIYQKKWKTVSKTMFCGLRVRPKRPKEMEKHW